MAVSSRFVGAKRPPAIVVGGDANALSVARNLTARGIEVFALNRPDSPVLRSRDCTALSCAPGAKSWRDYLLSPEAIARFEGAVLLTCSDEAISLMIDAKADLARHYRVEIGEPMARRRLLDKLATYRTARAAGVPFPQFWNIDGLDDLARLAPDLIYPIVIKPTFGPPFSAAYGQKFLRARDRTELERQLADVFARGFSVVLMEFIPGPDARLCSYYTYMDERGQPLLHFTKRVARRYPVNMGGATYHLTDRVPQAQELGLRLFRHAGLRGLGNVEFKLDERDGQLKIIECNARFTAANELVEQSGIPLAYFVYRQLIGDPVEAPDHFRTGLRMVDPVRDALAFRQLARRGDQSFGSWLRSLSRARVLPYLSARDPMPGLVYHQKLVGGLLRKRLRRSARAAAETTRAGRGPGAESDDAQPAVAAPAVNPALRARG